jgi:RimJ/RimL family protein N-acetyltransferase
VFELASKRLRLIALDKANLRLSITDSARMAVNLQLTTEGDWPGPELRQALREMLQGAQLDPDNHLWYTSWQIVERTQRRLVGGLCFKGPPDGAGVVEIGYGLLPGHQGRGYMTEALRAIVDWAFEQPGVRAIVAETEGVNQASHRVVQRVGFTVYRADDQVIWWRLQRGVDPNAGATAASSGKPNAKQGQL